MDRIIYPPANPPKAISTPSVAQTKASTSFSDVMSQYTDAAQSGQTDSTATDKLILVGEITKQNPTVSELLIEHKDLRASTWNILGAAQNKNRDFTNIQPGTRIYYSPTDGQLSWSNETAKVSEAEQASPPLESAPYQLYQSIDSTQQESQNTNQLALGKISDHFPTVSHLLKNNPQLREQTWELIGNTVNAGKPYHAIPSGTEIFFNKDTMEISWDTDDTGLTAVRPEINNPAEPVAQSNAAAPRHPDSPATDLSEAVQQYLGTPYEKINCYELIVKGLGHMNIPYSGKGGLYTELTKMAKDRGMASNAYLNGEGIVKAAGTLVLSKEYSGQGNWEDEAASLISAVEPLLDSGQILSFSTRRRGHTGIVSRQNDQWTFINSGRLDHSVTSDSVRKGVGEEVLQEEIRNWYKLAHKNNESLSVTLGQLAHDKIQTTLNIPESFPKRT